MKKNVLTLREMLHYLNAQEEDVDIYVDGIDSIAVCGGEIGLTEEGKKEFGSILDMHMDGHCIIGTDDDYEDLDNDVYGRLALAWDFINALAGYCSVEDYAKWFEGEDVEYF